MAFQNALNYLSDRRRAFGTEPRYIRILDAKDIAPMARDARKLAEIKVTPLLAIDDMGREATEVLNYGNATSPVIDLLEHRYNNQLFTIITTNKTPRELREKYGARMADRFNEMLHVINYGTEASYRIRPK